MQIYQSLLALSGLSISVVQAQQPINENYNFKIATRWREWQRLNYVQFVKEMEVLCSQHNVMDISLGSLSPDDRGYFAPIDYAATWTQLEQDQQQEIFENCPGFGVYVPFTITSILALEEDLPIRDVGFRLCQTAKENAFTGLELNNLDTTPLTESLISKWHDLIRGCLEIGGVDLRISSLDLYYNVTASETGTLRIVDVLKKLPENARPSRFAIQRYEDDDKLPITRNNSYEGIFLDPQDGVNSLLEAYEGYVNGSTFQVKVPITPRDDIGGANWVDGQKLAAYACRAHNELGWTAGYYANSYHSQEQYPPYAPPPLPELSAMTSPCL